MKTNLLRAGALACALLTTTALTAPALAQTGQTVPPEARSVDGNGVDLISGDYVVSLTEAAIGSGEGALALVRTGTPTAMTSNWQNVWMEQTVSGSVTTVKVILGDHTETFTKTGSGAFTPELANGATLTGSVGSNYIYTGSDGTVITFGTTASVGAGTSPFCAHSNANPNNCNGLALSIVRPNGARLTFDWDIRPLCFEFQPPIQNPGCLYFWRLSKISNNFGYEIGFTFVSDTLASPDFNIRSGAQLSNSNVSGETPLAVSYAYSGGVTTVTVPSPAGETHSWRFDLGSNTFGIRRPGSTSDNISVAFGSSGVTQVVRDGVTTQYSRSVSGSSATTTITQVDGDSGTTDPVTTAVADLSRGRITSVTDPLSQQTSYTYDSNDRLTRATMPEGNSVGYTYDARGNVTETRLREKGDTGDTADDIVASATYPSSCSNVATCNLPTTTTDARGNVTDYEYDPTHGGVTRVTLPAPGSGLTRPQTRYSYSQITAVTGQPVYRLTQISACQTQSGASGATPAACAGAADEVRTIVSYDSINVRPTSVETRAGNGSLSVVTATTYNAYGDALTVDGPLSGSADTTTIRYDAARRPIGTISPDPDGGGALKRRAVRTTYRADGQVSLAERGTVEGTSDSDWTNFAGLERVEAEYDSSNRPYVQRLVSGGTTYALTQTGYDPLGRVRCVAQRMNAGEFATSSLPTDACALDTAGSVGPDRIARTTYDAAGRPTLVETGVGVIGVAADEVRTSYTNDGQVATLTDAEGNLTTYEYDGFDRLLNTRYPSPAQGSGTSSASDYEQLGYDAAGNLVSRRLRDGTSIAYGYDALGRLTSKDLPGSEPTVSYTYDNLGRMLSAASPAQTLSFTYDALSRNLTQVGPHGTLTSAWDAAGRRTSLTYADSGLVVGYAYDVLGETTEIRENPAGSNTLLATYAYDNLGRRTSLIRGNGSTLAYSYDPVSRLASMAHDFGGTANDLTLGFDYNPASQIVSHTRSNDAFSFIQANANVASGVNGLNQLTSLGGAGVRHDARGNVTGIGSSDYGYSTENMLITGPNGATLGYDPANRLYQTSANGATTRFGYDGGQMIAEYDGANALQRRYVFGPGIDEPIVWYEGSTVSSTTRRYLHADERGSIVAVTDNSGNLIGSLNRYDEHGVPQGGAITGRFGYTGQAFLPEIGMYYYRARIYNPNLPRFMQTDPIGYGAGMNLYAYASNNPINLTDPSGLSDDKKDPPPKCVGDICGGGITTGSRISVPGSYICGSCSGWSTMSLTGDLGPMTTGSIDTYKVSNIDRATKSLVGDPWIEARGTGGIDLFLTTAIGGVNRCWQPIVCELWADRDVQRMMLRAWIESNPHGPRDFKSERGFWITQNGSDFIAHDMLMGINGSRFLDNVIRSAPPGASIFFHTHPFTAAEGGVMGFSPLVDNPLINANPWYSFVIFGYMNRNNDVGFDSIDRRGR